MSDSIGMVDRTDGDVQGSRTSSNTEIQHAPVQHVDVNNTEPVNGVVSHGGIVVDAEVHLQSVGPVGDSGNPVYPARSSIEDVGAYDSISQQGSQHSSQARLLLGEVAVHAELTEKQKLLTHRQQLERRKFDLRIKREQEDFLLKQEMEQLEMLEKISVVAARSKVMSLTRRPASVHTQVDQEVAFKLSPSKIQGLDKIDLCERISKDPSEGEKPADPLLPVSSGNILNACVNPNFSERPYGEESRDTGNQLKELVHSLRKPVVEIKKFGGDPTEYNRFVRQLNSVVLVHCSSYEDKLNALEMYTFGQPNQIVASFSYLDAKAGFETAMKELRERYGNPYVMATAFIKKALDWEEIKANNAVSLDNFSIFLSECLYAVSHFHNLDTLNNSGNIQKLMSKIPFHLHDKWRSYIRRFQDKDEIIVFEHFVSFVKGEAKKLNDPIFGKEAISSLKPQNKLSTGKPEIKRNFSVSTTEVSSKACHFCKAEHFIGDCNKLLGSSRDQIMSVLSKERLCFGCLKFGHQKHKCWKKLKCAKCGAIHPTLLHYEDTSAKTEQSCHVCANTEAGGFTTLPIIPVIVQNGLKCVKTYAFHDCGSSVCFCSDSLLQKLGVSGNMKKICIETMSSSKFVNSVEAKNLEVFSLDYGGRVDIPSCYSVQSIPATKQHVPTMKDIEMFPHLKGIVIPDLNSNIDLLIGNNVPDAFRPLRYKKGPSGTPHASKTKLGWLLWNVVRNQGDCIESIQSGQVLVNRISAEVEKTNELDRLMRNAYNFDFPERLIDDRKENSVLDNVFLEQVSNSIQKVGKQYDVKLPFKPSKPLNMPNNYNSAVNRLKSLRSKFFKNQSYKIDYVQFMNSMLEKNYCEEVPEKEVSLDSGKDVWFIPHHGVYHKKKNKIRVVFDCSARYEGVCINDNLLSGPDLANSLVGVLIRFRLGTIAMMADIEGMFCQIKVPASDRNYLRFLWWPEGDTTLEPRQYRMTAHIFGAVSSPSVANFVLQKTAVDNAHLFDSEVLRTVLDNFYVDDCLRSIDGESNAIELVDNLVKLLKLGGFRLHKFISNNKAVLESLPESECANTSSRVLGDSDALLERALGVNWEVSTDSFTFQINVQDKPKTRRGILSMVSSVFDPLGLAAPALLPAKLILKDICSKGYSWDQALDGSILDKWNLWIIDLPLLESVCVKRCVKSVEQKNIVSVQLHHFSDASETGYGVASYIRLVDSVGHISCSLLLGKARVAPLKRITIPRMELTAATLAVKLNRKIVDELKIAVDKVSFWTDSSTVLSYISNDSLRYQTFVANRVSVIRDATDISQWNFIPGKLNPADDASRGLPIKAFLNQRRWFDGPEFLHRPEPDWPKFEYSKQFDEKDPNIKRSFATEVCLEHPLEKLLCHYSSFSKLVRAVSYLKRCTQSLYNRCFPTKAVKIVPDKYLTVNNLLEAELILIKYEQSKFWNSYVNSKSVPVKGDLSKLDPVLKDNVLRVGGRLNRSSLSLDSKNQILMPRKSRLSQLLISKVHKTIGHLGKNSIISELRKTYWIVGVGSLIKELLSKCVSCKRYRADRLVQKMADLPPQRVLPFQPPFHHTGMDFFGPFELKRGRSLVKRYGVIFTCLNSRAVHLEVAHSLDTDSCINAIRRFISRRGKPKSILSDNGTNIVASAKELKKGVQELDKSKFGADLSKKGIVWECNPPAASHFGGVWERLIRQVRKVFSSLQAEQLSRLDDESFVTLLCEVEAILNNRPITRNSDSPDDLDALTPNHILQNGSRFDFSVTAPDRTDLYIKRRWRQVQYLSDLFWRRWLAEYVPSLQERAKWLRPKANVTVGDIVLVVDNGIRNSWSLARVIEVKYDKKGYVRIVTVKTKTGTLVRPIHKLCLILEADNE